MCTVSLLPLTDPAGAVASWRLVSNRDESRARSVAAPPGWRRVRFDPSHPGAAPAKGPGVREGRALWPMDSEAGGTWIAAGAHGLALCLLNCNPVAARGIPAGRVSRGLVIPSLIGAPGVEAAVDALPRLGLGGYAPFRLLAVGPRAEGKAAMVAEVRWADGQLRVSEHDPASPLCLVSSGLGDELVTPRLGLFETMVASGEGGWTPDRQDEFHRHSWADRPEISVLMSRADARTVSITTVELPAGAGRPAMRYEPVAEGAAETRVRGAR